MVLQTPLDIMFIHTLFVFLNFNHAKQNLAILGTPSPGLQQPGCTADDSPPSSAEATMSGATPLLPLYVFMVYYKKTMCDKNVKYR
jgi:hypothetical protein